MEEVPSRRWWNWVGVVSGCSTQMIPALTRRNGDHAMTKDTTKEAAMAPELDPIRGITGRWI